MKAWPVFTRLCLARALFAEEIPSRLSDKITSLNASPVRRSQALLGGGQHLFEPRIVTEASQIRIDFAVINHTWAHLFECRAQDLQSRFLVIQVIGQRARRIVAYRYVFGIDQHGAFHPFFCSLTLTERGQSPAAVTHGRAVVRI